MQKSTKYLFRQEQDLGEIEEFRHRRIVDVGISFDSSKLAALDRDLKDTWIWDLSSRALLHTVGFPLTKRPIPFVHTNFSSQGRHYLNTETFRDEHLEDPSDRFPEPDRHLSLDGLFGSRAGGSCPGGDDSQDMDE